MEIELVSRWLHLGTVIVLVGGAVFHRFVVVPASAQLMEPQASQLREGVIARWKRFVHGGIALLLLTGFYNYLAIGIPSHRGDKIYHAVMGTKILLALVLFGLISVLVGRSKGTAGLRANAPKWQLVAILLAASLVLASGYLKVMHPKQPAAVATTAE